MRDMSRFDSERLRQLIANHARYTGSARARKILENWDAYLPKFRKVMPVEYRRALAELAAQTRAAMRCWRRESEAIFGLPRIARSGAILAGELARFLYRPRRRAVRRLTKATEIMGKVTGFLEIDRADRRYAPASDRIRHYREFVLPLRKEATRNQAARCMNCGIPYCHNGCPVNNQIPDWNDLVYRGDWQEASRNLHTHQ